MSLSRDELRDLFDYDAASGILTWRKGKRKGFTAGGAGNAGYLYVHVTSEKRNLRVHRIIWKWVTGEEPTLDIDHKNRNRADNRWENLRALTRAQNRRHYNPPKPVFHVASGLWHVKKQLASKQASLGYFKTKEEAEAAAYGAMKAFEYARKHGFSL